MARDKTLTIRWAADGSDDELIDALAPYARDQGGPGESLRAKILLRRALGMPEPQDSKPLDESTFRRVLREELGRVRLAGSSPADEHSSTGMRGASEEA